MLGEHRAEAPTIETAQRKVELELDETGQWIRKVESAARDECGVPFRPIRPS